MIQTEWPELWEALDRILNREAQMTGNPPSGRRLELQKLMAARAVPCLSPSGHHWVRTQCTHCDLHLMGRRTQVRDIDQLRMRDGTVYCFYCGDYGDTVDHVIPLAQNGPDTLDNKVIACRQCNGEKADRTPGQWKPRWYEQETMDVA